MPGPSGGNGGDGGDGGEAGGGAGGVAAGPSGGAPVPLSPALEKLAWMQGTWNGNDTLEDWVAVGGVLWGVAWDGRANYEVMAVDDGEGKGPPDGALRIVAMPRGQKPAEFKATRVSEAQEVLFANPEHDYPREITYRREGELLVSVLGSTPDQPAEVVNRMRPAVRQRSPELEDADRAFAAAVAARGVDAWVEAFTAEGTMALGGELVEHDGIADAMRPTLTGGTLAWAPVTSSWDNRGIGYTIGLATYTAAKPEDSWRSTYATIWVKRKGTFKVMFDTGRIINE
jgi:hypothetical protein